MPAVRLPLSFTVNTVLRPARPTIKSPPEASPSSCNAVPSPDSAPSTPTTPVPSTPMSGAVPLTPMPRDDVDSPSTPARPPAPVIPFTPTPDVDVPLTPVPPFAEPRTPVPAFVTPLTPESNPPDAEPSVPRMPAALLDPVPTRVVVAVSPVPFTLLDATPGPDPLFANDEHALVLVQVVSGPAPPSARTRPIFFVNKTVPT